MQSACAAGAARPGDNGLQALPADTADLVNLTLLDLSGNKIGADGARTLAGLVNLTSLDL
jgi:hypothetical protein